jgi:hypothetical protein
MIDGGSRYKMNLKNVRVLGKLTTENVTEETVYGENIECGGIEGHGTYLLKSSKVISNTAADAIPNAAGSYLEYCTVDSLGNNVAAGSQCDVTIIKSKINGIVDSDTHGQLKLYDCEVNGVEKTYFDRSMRATREISPTFRIGGSAGTIKIETYSTADVASSIEIDVGTYEMLNTDNIVYFHFATPIPEATLRHDKRTEIVIMYIDENGVNRSEKYTNLEIDTTSLWDGLQNGEEKYIVEFDVSNFPYPIGEDRNIRIDLLIFPDVGDPGYLYLDTEIKGRA